MNDDNKKINYGEDYKNLFGPVFYKFIYKLDQYIQYLDDGKTCFLYVTRAGYRIKKLYTLYKKESLGEHHRILLASRFLMAKSLLTSKHSTVKENLKEGYRGKNINDFIFGLTRFDNSTHPESFMENEYENIEASEFIEYFDQDIHSDLYFYLSEEHKKYQQYFKMLTKDYDRVVLIDSGWNGTIQKMFMEFFPEKEFFGLYFGKIIGQTPDWSVLQRMKGIMFEINSQNNFNTVLEWDKESVFNIHRHLIEDLLEPSFPTIEYIEDSTHLMPNLNDEEDENFKAIASYFENAYERSISTIFKASNEALEILKEKIMFPEEEAIQLLGNIQRSFDFGKEGSISVLLEPKDRFIGDSKKRRIKESIWSQGQIFLEYKSQNRYFVYHKQRENLQLIPIRESKKVAKLNETKVAIITRTMDREVLLRRAKESVENQSFKDYIWIIINDAGDITPVLNVVNDTLIDPRNIIVVNNLKNIGMEAASNRAIGMVESKYIIIHDDDDSWNPYFLEKTVDFLESKYGKKYGAVITDTIYVSESIEGDTVTIHEKRPYNDWVNNVHITEMAHGNIFAPICFLFKREIYDTISGFDESLPVLGDWDFNLRYLMVADIGVLKEPLAYYHHRDKNIDVASSYSNSVIGGMSKHMEYAPIVKNKFIRINPEVFGIIVSNGFVHQDMRTRSNSMENRMANLERMLSDLVLQYKNK